MLRTWAGLRTAADVNGGWDEAQCRLAKDMLGIRLELRNAGGTVSTETDAATLVGAVEREVDRLQGLLESHLIVLDDGAQRLRGVKGSAGSD